MRIIEHSDNILPFPDDFRGLIKGEFVQISNGNGSWLSGVIIDGVVYSFKQPPKQEAKPKEKKKAKRKASVSGERRGNKHRRKQPIIQRSRPGRIGGMLDRKGPGARSKVRLWH